jgi:2-amino-4-hydroxy-6-hydroxymethyldihydropteridine diphosphokinase
MSVRAHLGLGANLGDPRRNVLEAIERLAAPEVRLLRRARLYRSPPLGPPGQPDYVNTAVEVETSLSPRQLLEHAKGVERALHRVTTVRWGPRTVDVDLLLYGDRRVDEPDLIIPHRELSRRAFVLAPLADLDPALQVPGLGRTVGSLLGDLAAEASALEVLEDGVLELGAPRRDEGSA